MANQPRERAARVRFDLSRFRQTGRVTLLCVDNNRYISHRNNGGWMVATYGNGGQSTEGDIDYYMAVVSGRGAARLVPPGHVSGAEAARMAARGPPPPRERFVAAATYLGARPGYVFTTRRGRTGYYLEDGGAPPGAAPAGDPNAPRSASAAAFFPEPFFEPGGRPRPRPFTASAAAARDARGSSPSPSLGEPPPPERG